MKNIESNFLNSIKTWYMFSYCVWFSEECFSKYGTIWFCFKSDIKLHEMVILYHLLPVLGSKIFLVKMKNGLFLLCLECSFWLAFGMSTLNRDEAEKAVGFDKPSDLKCPPGMVISSLFVLISILNLKSYFFCDFVKKYTKE